VLKLPLKITNLVKALAWLPGVGERSATRHALFLSTLSASQLEEFSVSVRELADIRKCSECGFFSEGDLCELCESETRKNSGVICVVESISDALAIENGQHYKGLLHILGGVLSPLAGIGPDDIGIDKLFQRVEEYKIGEIILALNPSVEGDATSAYIKQETERRAIQSSVKRIGFGIPIGGSLEYLDPLTISKALENKRSF